MISLMLVLITIVAIAPSTQANPQLSLENFCERARSRADFLLSARFPNLLEASSPVLLQDPGEPVVTFPPRVDADLKAYDEKVEAMNREFSNIPADPMDKEWVKKKLQHMVDVDQYMRNQVDLPFRNKYSKEEQEYFWQQFMPRWERVDLSNTQGLKDLLKIYTWFKASEFGGQADLNAWLLVQHADHDVAFQKHVLAVLEKLYPVWETHPAHYAYLYDRIASHENRLQRYATQGRCIGPGQWEPFPTEEPDKVDERRKAMGLEPLEEYKKRFKDICH